MIANVTSEPYTLMMGLHMNNVGWKLFVESGLVYAPFILMFLKNYIKAKTSGKDDGPLGDLLLNFVEADLYKMVAVLVFCVIPMSSSGTNSTSFKSYSCTARNLTEDNKLKDASVIGGVTELTPKVQLWWWLTHQVSTYITNYMVANVPCADDFRFAQTAFDSSKIEDTNTQMFANVFYEQCFSPAMNHIVKSGNVDNAQDDLLIGSAKAMEFYRKETSVMTINKDYWNKIGGDASAIDEARGPEAYPNCNTAYNQFSKEIDKEVERLNEESWVNDWLKTNDSLKNGVMNKTMVGAASRTGAISSGRQTNNQAFKDVAGGAAVDTSGNWVTNSAVAVAAEVKFLSSSVDAVMYRTMAPHVVAAMQMIVMAVVPLLLILSGLNFATVGVLTGWYFALEFTLVIEEIGYWFDNMMTTMMNDNTGVFTANGVGEKNILGILGNLSYQWFPMVWLALVSVLGVKSVGGTMGTASTASQGGASTIASGASKAAGGAGGVGKAIGSKIMKR